VVALAVWKFLIRMETVTLLAV